MCFFVIKFLLELQILSNKNIEYNIKNNFFSSVIATYNYYNLLKIDAEAIVELAAWPGMKDPASKIEPKAFSAFLKIFSFKFYNLLISLLYSLKKLLIIL